MGSVIWGEALEPIHARKETFRPALPHFMPWEVTISCVAEISSTKQSQIQVIVINSSAAQNDAVRVCQRRRAQAVFDFLTSLN